MPTRRELLLSIAAIPLAEAFFETPLAPVRPEPEILEEPHCLSEESAKGFRLLLSRNKSLSRNVIVAPASRRVSHLAAVALYRRVAAGTWLILESGLPFVTREEAAGQLQLVRNVFGFAVQPPCPVRDGYIEYTWPLRRWVRHFSMIAPLQCSTSEIIAEWRGVPVCAKRPVGRGGIVFLGSMLGPGLLAEEKEAHEVGAGLLRQTAFRS